MKSEYVDAVRREVYRRFPDMKGTVPQITAQDTTRGKSTYLLTFRQMATVAGGRKLPRWVRVVADEDGRILKLTTSK